MRRGSRPISSGARCSCEVGDDGLLAAVERRVADAGQALVGEDLDRDEVAARRADDDLDVGDFHRLIPGGCGRGEPVPEAVVDAPLARIGVGDRRQQRLGVVVRRVVDDLVGVARLDDLAAVHDRDAVAHVADHRHVVGDEHVGEAELVLQPHHQVEHLGAQRDVERGGRLVGDDEARLRPRWRGRCRCAGAGRRRRRAGSARARRARGRPAAISSATRASRSRPRMPASFSGSPMMLRDGLARVERGDRVLEDHPDLAADRRQRAPCRRCAMSTTRPSALRIVDGAGCAARRCAGGSGRSWSCPSRLRRRCRGSRRGARRATRRRRPCSAGREGQREVAHVEERAARRRERRARRRGFRPCVSSSDDGADQHAGVGVLRGVEDALDRALLHRPCRGT